MRRIAVELKNLISHGKIISEVVKVVKKDLPKLEVNEIVSVLKTISEQEHPRMLPLASAVFEEMLQRAPENVNHEDAMSLLTISSKLKLFDSDVLNRVFPVVRIETVSDLKKVVGACNSLNFVFQDKDRFYTKINGIPFKEAQLRHAAIPLLRYIANDLKANGLRNEKVPVINQALEALSEKVKMLQADEELVKQRSVVSTDDALKFLALLAKNNKAGGDQIKPLISGSVIQDIKFILTRVVACDLRSLNLDQSLKLFFSLGELGVFDDFFVRRRLVPAIAHSFSNDSDKTSGDCLLVITAMSQLPFRNQMVDETVQMISVEVKKFPNDDEVTQAIRSMIDNFNRRY
jgi:hypothetical protein